MIANKLTRNITSYIVTRERINTSKNQFGNIIVTIDEMVYFVIRTIVISRWNKDRQSLVATISIITFTRTLTFDIFWVEDLLVVLLLHSYWCSQNLLLVAVAMKSSTAFTHTPTFSRVGVVLIKEVILLVTTDSFTTSTRTPTFEYFGCCCRWWYYYYNENISSYRHHCT